MFGWIKKGANKGKDYGMKVLNVEQIKENSTIIKDMANIVLNPNNQRKGKIETFNQAVQRLHVSEVEIKQIYLNYAYSFYISITLAFICLLYLLYSLFISNSFFTACSSLAIFLFCLSNSFKYSFLTFKIKHQKLCSVNDWWNRSSDWFPSLNISDFQLKEKSNHLMIKKDKDSLQITKNDNNDE